MTFSRPKVIEIAEKELGTLEEKDGGSKYGRDLVKWIGAPYAVRAHWCDMFVDWCFIKAYGKEGARKMLGGFSAYTPTSASYFKERKRWHTEPEAGDVVFFTNGIRICHTGIVTSVTSTRINTIEGNTTTPNGDGVARRSYKRGDGTIAGYGRPPYPVGDIPARFTKIGTVPARIKRGTTVHVQPGKCYPEVDFSPLAKDRKVTICYQTQSAFGITWYFVQVGPHWCYVPASCVEVLR